MKIVLSRKGFDSASGGTPSPIFPDGRMLSLPIPDKHSPIKYHDITWHEYHVGAIVSALTKGKVRPDRNAHLDPDLNPASLQRPLGWKPLFGQRGSARGHLRNHDITTGDVFLFFGLFQEVTTQDGRLAWKKDSPRKHVIWAWMRIGQIIPITTQPESIPGWARYHPHFHGDRGQNNTLYIAEQAGVFTHYDERLQLTMPGATSPCQWQLPGWMHPGDNPPLSYHASPERWKKTGNTVELHAVARGQEFVLDATAYPEANEWLQSLITRTQ